MIRRKQLLTFALALSAGAALAQGPGKGPGPQQPPGNGGPQGGQQGDRERRPPPPIIAALDTDGDGTISATEIQNAPESLKKLDKNHDGKLTMDELRPQRPEGGPGGPGGQGGAQDGQRQRKGPADGDGRRGPGQDGGPSGKPANAPQGGPQGGGPQGGGPQGGGPQGAPEGRGGRRPVPPIIAALDTDGDGVISASEIANAAESLKKLDKNSDGQLTPDEIRPAPPQRDGQGNGPKGPGDAGNKGGGDAKKRPAAE